MFDFYLILPDGSKQQNQIKKSLYYDDRRKLEQAAGTIKEGIERGTSVFLKIYDKIEFLNLIPAVFLVG